METKNLKKISENIQNAFLSLKTKEEVFNFLRDLLTEKEIGEFSQRFEVAKMLHEGISYKEIENITGASSTTIARISKFLHGKFGGYKNIIEKTS